MEEERKGEPRPTLRYAVRHPEHKENVLTLVGVAQAVHAAEQIRADIKKIRRRDIDEKDNVVIVHSEEPRTVMAAAIIAGVLGVKMRHGPQKGLNPASGLNDAIKAGRIPESGERGGMIKTWKTEWEGFRATRNLKNVEDLEEVNNRAYTVLSWRQSPHPDIIIAVSHGGVIEPAISGLMGADDRDVAMGQVVSIDAGWTVNYLPPL